MIDEILVNEGIEIDGHGMVVDHAETPTRLQFLDGQDEPKATQSRSRGRRVPFAQMLVDAGILSSGDVQDALRTAKREGIPLSQILVRDGLIVSRDMATFTALHLGLTMVDLRNEEIDPKVVHQLPIEMARKYLAIAIRMNGDRLTVALTDPTDLKVIQDLTIRTGHPIDPVIATPEDITEHIDLTYRMADRQLAESGESDNVATGLSGNRRLTAEQIRNTPPGDIIDLLLQQALQDRASDIHIEPDEFRLKVRFRIDSILHEVMGLPLDIHPAIISRLKIMSGMNIAERRRSQDGQLVFEGPEGAVDVRVAISNTVSGEMAVLRVLDNTKFTVLNLGQLGMEGQGLEQYKKLLKLPYGMILVAGPTGSGKSTSLYASVLQMDRSEQKIITIEDPVEYSIPNTMQMQVHAEAGITFATQLRSILRLDPDVIFVGEIRDHETANIAIEAALTGHLVLSSIHANDAVSAVTRLRDLGVPPYLIASSLAGVVAQRMVRVICKECRTAISRPISEHQAYELELGESLERFDYGSGCTFCAQTGYRGRTGVFEILAMTDKIKQMFLEEAPSDKLLEQALADGMIPMRRGAMMKVKTGATTPKEVMRVLFTL